MNRNQQIAKRAQGGGQAISLSNLRFVTRYLDPDYDLFQHNLVRSETGFLPVFSLVSKNPAKPNFNARIDDGNPENCREPELDIDIKGVSKQIERDFNANRNGYLGHHTDKSVNQNQRIFDVKIASPAGSVFDGDVSFNVTFAVGLAATATAVATVHAVVVSRTSTVQRQRYVISALKAAYSWLFSLLKR